MLNPRSRRQFLGDVGKGMLIAAIGPALACDLGLAKDQDVAGEALSFGGMEELVGLLQETPIGNLPRAHDLNVEGLSIDASGLEELLAVDHVGWKHELGEIGSYLDSYGVRTPGPLKREQQRIADA